MDNLVTTDESSGREFRPLRGSSFREGRHLGRGLGRSSSRSKRAETALNPRRQRAGARRSVLAKRRPSCRASFQPEARPCVRPARGLDDPALGRRAVCASAPTRGELAKSGSAGLGERHSRGKPRRAGIPGAAARVSGVSGRPRDGGATRGVRVQRGLGTSSWNRATASQWARSPMNGLRALGARSSEKPWGQSPRGPRPWAARGASLAHEELERG